MKPNELILKLTGIDPIPVSTDLSSTSNKKEMWDALGTTIGAPRYSKLIWDEEEIPLYSKQSQIIRGSLALEALGFSEEAATSAMDALGEDLSTLVTG